MPSILAHAAVPLAVGLGLGPRRVPRALLAAGIAASMLPDADVVAFAMRLAWDHAYAHRGASHSLGAALLVGLLAAACARALGTSAGRAFLFVGGSMASHGVLDMFTDGGAGIALAWPLSDERWFAPWQPIAVSPIGLSRFFSMRGLEVIVSEAIWVWIPALGAYTSLRLFDRDAPGRTLSVRRS